MLNEIFLKVSAAVVDGRITIAPDTQILLPGQSNLPLTFNSSEKSKKNTTTTYSKTGLCTVHAVNIASLLISRSAQKTEQQNLASKTELPQNPIPKGQPINHNHRQSGLPSRAIRVTSDQINFLTHQ